jgi:thiamine-phosphate pyrophosphorylase
MASDDLDGARRRGQLADARLMLLFTPAACDRDARAQLEALIAEVDVIQVRPKPLGQSKAPAPARQCVELARLVLEVARGLERPPLVIVDDRVDVARALQDEGVDGVHLGQDDAPPELARGLLGPGALIGLSTHSMAEVVAAGESPIDYLGFGPIHGTPTKGARQGLGPELAWVADQAAPGPLFPIGGIDLARADELARVGRAAVGAALLNAEDPAAEARDLRAALSAVD